jgi:hypothetical protein
MVRYNCIETGHLWLNGLDKCARCGLKWSEYTFKDEV